MSFCIDDKKFLEKYKATWTKIEAFKDIELNALLFYDDRYIKTLNVPEDDIKCEYFIVTSVDSLLV